MFALGIILLIIGIGFIVGEFFTGTYLLIGMGTVFVIIGIVFLATAGSDWFHVNWWLVTIILIIAACVLGFVIFRIRDTYHHQVTTGKEDLKGKSAIVKETLDPEGTVLFEGELWNAVSDSGKILPGEEVTITGAHKLTLIVMKKG